MVSVITPAFNAESFILETIESVRAQTYENWELIICDDGSTDGTIGVIKSVSDSRIHVIEGGHRGMPAVARNRSLQVATGEFFAFLDADDLWLPIKLEKQLQFLDQHKKCGLVFSQFITIDKSSNMVSNKPLPELSLYPELGNYFQTIAKNNLICNSSVMIRSEVYKVLGDLNESAEHRGTEDFEYWLRVASQFEIGYVEDALVKYRLHGGGISRNILTMRKGAYLAVQRMVGREDGSMQAPLSSRAFDWALAALLLDDKEHQDFVKPFLEEVDLSVKQKIVLKITHMIPAKLRLRYLAGYLLS